jgi:hypothetical protein
MGWIADATEIPFTSTVGRQRGRERAPLSARQVYSDQKGSGCQVGLITPAWTGPQAGPQLQGHNLDFGAVGT